MDLLFYPRDEDVDDIVLDLGEHLFVVRVKLVMLGRHNNRVNALGNTFVAILYGNLTLGVGA